jgi:hypothetical protein
MIGSMARLRLSHLAGRRQHADQQREDLMTDIAALDNEILRIAGTAQDEATLEAARVAALGKKGSVSALLATLGKM